MDEEEGESIISFQVIDILTTLSFARRILEYLVLSSVLIKSKRIELSLVVVTKL
jgi:hypothetical protein